MMINTIKVIVIATTVTTGIITARSRMIFRIKGATAAIIMKADMIK